MMRHGGWMSSGPPAKLSGKVSKRQLARQVGNLFSPYGGVIAVIVVLVLFTAGLGVTNPVLIKVVFDHGLNFGHGLPNLPLLYLLVGVMVGVSLLSGAVGIVQTWLTNKVGQRVMEDLRNQLYAHLQQMSLRFFTATRTGEIQSRLTNDVGGIQTVVTDTASSILSNVVILISTIVAMVVISWQLTVLSMAMMPLFIGLTARAGKARRIVTMKAQQSKAEMSAITEETLSVSGILLSKVFGRRQEDLERFRAENRRLADLGIRQTMIGRSLFASVQAFFSSAPALVYLVAGWVITGDHASGITAGTIVAFTTLQSRLFFPVGQMLQISVEVQSSLALFERIFEYLALPHDIADKDNPIRLQSQEVRGEVTLEHVSFRYDRAPLPGAEAGGEALAATETRTWALRDISLRIAPGQLAALVGPSGAGKTTISYLIPRFYDVTEGSVRIDGHDIRDLAISSLSEIVSMVTQETYLFHASIRRNLLYAKPDANEEELVAACKAAFIHDRIAQLPDGYDTTVGERGYRMSGGEKQRLAIARVILKSPRILILDEATSALDTTSERLVQAALGPLMKGRTTIAIAHRLSTILAADVIFVIDAGRLVEQGTHEELLRNGGLYATLYEQQFLHGQKQLT